MVARAAGVALVTASYALKNNPKISLATRDRVRAAAIKLGYVPDPEIGRLMHMLRAGRSASPKSTIALLSFDSDPRAERNQYFNSLIQGVEQRARDLGYSTDLISVNPAEVGSARLAKILQSRGIQGIVIPPLRHATQCSTLLDWSQFSIIAATYTAQQIVVHRVVPHHLQIGLLSLAQLQAKGYKRLGLITEPGDHERVNYSFLAALAMHQQAGHFARIPARQFSAQCDLLEWHEKYHPDVILTTEKRQISTLLSALGPARLGQSPVFLLNHPRDFAGGGVDQHPEVVGKIALELLAGQIQRGERGYVEHPTVMMVEGSWIDPQG
jgi:DNA-binding LacI/PurR family transcriptional regulator